MQPKGESLFGHGFGNIFQKIMKDLSSLVKGMIYLDQITRIHETIQDLKNIETMVYHFFNRFNAYVYIFTRRNQRLLCPNTLALSAWIGILVSSLFIMFIDPNQLIQ